MTALIKLATAHGAFLNEGGHGIPAGTLITFEPAELEAFAAALAARPDAPPEVWGRLYDAASKLIVAIGYHGDRSRWDAEVLTLQDSLRDLDDGGHIAGLMPASASAPEAQSALRAVLAEYEEGYGLRCIDQVRAALAAPSTPCSGCNGRGEVGGLRMDGYHTEECPFCKGSGIEAVQLAAPSTPAAAALCHHEAYQGRCIHCDAPFVNGSVQLAATKAAPSTPAAAPVAYRYKDSRGHWRYVGYPFTPGWDMPSNIKHEPLYASQHAATQAQASEREPWLLYLSDRADGVKGHYAIARWNPKGYREVWNLRSHQWAAFSDEVLTLDEANALLQSAALATATPQDKP